MTENGVKSENQNLRQRASKGAFWGLSSNLSASAISFVGTAILARILSPMDFGLLGMAALVIGLVQLFGNLGLGVALVQKANIDDEYLSTAFWSSILASIGLVVVSIIAAPFASIFFNEPIVKWIIICLSVNYVISSCASIHRTLLYRDMRMKKIAFIEIISRFVRVIIMLICASAGMGFWSIVVGMMTESILKTIIFIVTSHWKPNLQFNKTKFRELFHYGKSIYGEGFLTYLNQNADFIITGKLLGAKLLGFYQFSYNLPYLVKTYVQDGIAPVAFPAFSKVQDDNDRLVRGFLSAVKYIAMTIFPVMFGLAFCAEDFISVVYGSRWLASAAPMKVLCFGAALASVHCIAFSLFNAQGRPDIGLKFNAVKLPITIIMVIGLSVYGLIGVAWAMFLVELFTVAIAYFAARLLNMPFTRYLRCFFPAVISSVIMIIFLCTLNTFSLMSSSVYLRLPINVVLGLCVYAASLYILSKNDFKEFICFARLCMNK